jgi:nucleotide-binding universal stress UspA family protein
MFDTIIWATDGSTHADHCQHFVRDLAQRYHSSLRIVHVVEKFPAWDLPAGNVNAFEDRTVTKLKAESAGLRRHGINASLHVVRGASGQPARQIADIAAQVAADLIIVGDRGRSELRHSVMIGGVARRLLETSACPVLVLPTALDRGRQLHGGTPASSLRPV